MLSGGGSLTGWKRVAGFGASVGQVVRVLAQNAVKACQEPTGYVLDGMSAEETPSQATYLLCGFGQMACPV